MKITQPDSRTIRVVTERGMSFFLPYRFSWNGHDREPASVVLETSGSGQKTSAEVKAYFLFGMVADRIRADSAGIIITRSWNVMTPGSVKVLLDVEFEATQDVVCLFPGVAVGKGLPSRPVSFLAERTSYPAALIVGFGNEAAVVFSRSARSEGDLASIGVSRTDREEEEAPRLRVEVRFPGVEEPVQRTGPRPGDHAEPGDPVIECSGNLTRTHELFLAFSERKDILTAAPAAVVRRLSKGAGKPGAGVRAPREPGRLAHELLSTHLVEDGGVTALREAPGSLWLSSTAGLSLAVSLRKLFPRDQESGETALRLADFSLKGQLPSGLFYESCGVGDGEWRGVRGQPGSSTISILHSARIADLLLMLAEVLHGQGLPFEKYFLAGQRFVDAFVDEKGKCTVPGSLWQPGRQPDPDDIGGWSILFPLVRVLDRLGKDRYKKALGAIAARFAAFPWDIFRPPSSRAGRDSDSAASLLAVRIFLELRGRGFRPAEPPESGASARSKSTESVRAFSSLLLPWIRIHGEGQPRLDGTLVDSFVRQRLLFAGNEAAYLLRQLAVFAGPGDLRTLLRSVAQMCMTSGADIPPGTAFYQHTRWDQEGREGQAGSTGPVDSRRLAGEILFGVLAADRPSPRARSPRTPRASGQSGRGGRSRKPSGKP
jgi:hypothetical protein